MRTTIFSILIVSLFLFSAICPFNFLNKAVAEPAWTIQTISYTSLGDASIVLDSNNYPHIAYTQWSPSNSSNNLGNNGMDSVIYSSWNGTMWTNQTVMNNAWFCSLALDSSGKPHIVLQMTNSGRSGPLMYASLSGNKWETQTIDPNGFDGSLALDSSNNPHVAYFTFGNSTDDYFLKYSSWTGSSWSSSVIDGGSLEYQPVLKLDNKNQAHIMYETESGAVETLKYATQANSRWTIAKTQNVVFKNMILDSNGLAYFGYNNFTQAYSPLAYATWNGQSLKKQTVNINETVLSDESWVALDAQNTPQLVFIRGYPSQNPSFKVLAYARLIGTSWAVQTIDSSPVQAGPLAIDSKGNPHVIYYDNVGASPPIVSLKYATINETTVALTTPTTTSTANQIQPFFVLILISLIIVVLVIFLAIVAFRRSKNKQNASILYKKRK